MNSTRHLRRATFLIFGLLTFLLHAQVQAGGREESALRSTLQELVGPLPAHIKLDQAATVTVQCHVSPAGKLEINSVEASVPALAAHVQTRLRDAVLKEAGSYLGKSYRVQLKYEVPR